VFSHGDMKIAGLEQAIGMERPPVMGEGMRVLFGTNGGRY